MKLILSIPIITLLCCQISPAESVNFCTSKENGESFLTSKEQNLQYVKYNQAMNSLQLDTITLLHANINQVLIKNKMRKWEGEILSDLIKIVGGKTEDFKEIWGGAYVVLDDDGDFYNRWSKIWPRNTLENLVPNVVQQTYGLRGDIIPEIKFSLIKEGDDINHPKIKTIFKLNYRDSTSGLKNLLLKIKKVGQNRFAAKTTGPLGTSVHIKQKPRHMTIDRIKETKDPLPVVIAAQDGGKIMTKKHRERRNHHIIPAAPPMKVPPAEVLPVEVPQDEPKDVPAPKAVKTQVVPPASSSPPHNAPERTNLLSSIVDFKKERLKKVNKAEKTVVVADKKTAATDLRDVLDKAIKARRKAVGSH